MSTRLLTVLVLVCSQHLLASDFDVIINEINYNPLSGIEDEEFLELYNRGGTEVDLSGWGLIEGIHLVFPEGTSIGPKSYLLVSPDAALARARYGADAVLGDYSGNLDNGGEIVTLVNLEGELISRVHFGDDDVWPSAPDGLGPTLELTDPFARPDYPESWAASLLVDGTPGAANSTLVVGPGPGEEITLIGDSETWRYRKGISEPPAGWRDPGFADGGWLSGATGIGYGDDDDATVLDDMEGGYLSFVARKRFTVTAEQLERIGAVTFVIDFDDGFVAYLNGVEFARQNVGVPGTPPLFNLDADGNHEAGDPELFTVPRALLEEGDNVLAVQVHNDDIDSTDVSFIPQLVARPPSTTAERGERSPLVINEVKATEAATAGFVELFNRGSAPVPVNGREIIDSLGNRFRINGRAPIPPGGFLVLADAELGFATGLTGVTYTIVESDGATFVDGFDPRPGLLGEHGFSSGRFPDGDNDGFVMTEPTPGASNRVDLVEDVVINEIQFHPPFVAPDESCAEDCSDLDQWIELRNRGAAAVDLSGWGLTSAVTFAFSDGASIAAGGYAIVAASRQRFLDAHPTVDSAIVFGNWRNALSHGVETINLRDRLGNLVDHVRYADGKPLNDVNANPCLRDSDALEGDDVDDGTFRGSEWPTEADGTGRTLELVHPALDNRHGMAWRAGPVGGTPGRQNAAFDAAPAPVVGSVRHVPAVPTSAEPVVVTCRASAAAPITGVRLLWARDGGGPSGDVVMRDDGLSGDGAPGDGTWGGTVPAQPDRAIVAFQIEAQAGGETTGVPAPPPVPPYGGFEGPYFLYQTLDAAPPPNPSPDYFIIMTSLDQDELETRCDYSNVLLPCTFIALENDGTAEVRHLAGVRYRGAGTRDSNPRSYKIEFPSERPFRGFDEINLNSQDIDGEILAGDLFLRAGIPAPQTRTVNLFFQGSVDPRYVRKEHLDGSFLTRYFGGGSDGGNLYRAFDPDGDPREGDLTYYGDDKDDYRLYYGKRTNREADDFTDVIDLCRVFDPSETPDEVFPERLEAVADVWQWARFFAVQACLSNRDGGLHSTSGEDYFLYRVPADSNRPDAGKWILIPWDIEETYDNAGERLFRPQIAAVRRFLMHPRYAPFYYCNLVDLRNGVFSRRETRQRFRLIDFLFNFSAIDAIDAYITARIGFLDENVPVALSSGAAGAAGGGVRLVALGETWSYFKGITSAPPGAPLAWTALGYDDGGWDEGPSGFGYDDGDDATVLDDMEGGYTTVYIRKVFGVQNAAAVPGLSLSVDFDDGFIAYLNGVEVARRLVAGNTGTPAAFDDTASGSHDAGTPEVIDISTFLGELRDGDNVLAFHGLNRAIDSSDFSLAPELLLSGIATGSLGCGSLVYTTDDVVFLTGRANACETREVRIDGSPAEYDSVLAQWSGLAAVELGENTITIEARDQFGGTIDTLEVTVRRLPGGLAEIGGPLAANTTLRAADGPFHMTSDITVPQGVTLTIEDGVTVFGAPGASILVRGHIEALGTAARPIRFRAETCADRWGGIEITDTGTGGAAPTHVLRQCDFEFGDTAPGAGGFVAPVNSRLLIEGCAFRNLTANAVDGTDSRFEVRDSFFEAIQEGVHGTRSTVIVVGCTFDGMVGDKDAIDFDGDGAERSRIEGCVMLNGSDDGIDLGGNTVDIVGNFFFNLQDKAISLERNGALGSPTVTRNVIFNCGTGIALKNGVTVSEGDHNTIVGNQEGINLFSKDNFPDGGHGVFDSLILWNNSFDVKVDARSTVSFAHSDISSVLWPGDGNISIEPRFMNVAGLDFSLRPGSPCIGSGRNGTDMGAIPFGGELPTFVRGDVNGSGTVNLTDVIYALDYLFRKGPAPPCADAMDANDDGGIDVSDAVRSLLYQFAAGMPLPPPFPDAGIDPTPDGLGCGR